jgi:hypothetical protein
MTAAAAPATPPASGEAPAGEGQNAEKPAGEAPAGEAQKTGETQKDAPKN